MNKQQDTDTDQIQELFETVDFNEDNLNMDKIKEKCKNEMNLKELITLKQIQTNLIIKEMDLNLNMLDSKGNKISKWSVGEKRGGFDYIPPSDGWKGFGLNVLNKYDGGNNDWLAKDGNKNEWAVAYHGVGIGGNGLTLEKVVNNIINERFKPGNGQAYAECDDARHPGQKVGKGVYCSPNPAVMETYASTPTSSNINNKYFVIGIMIRVKPDKIRCSNTFEDYWVLNGNKDEMRPYRILIKEFIKHNYKEINTNNNYDVNIHYSSTVGNGLWNSYVLNALLNYIDENGYFYNNVLTEAAIVGINGVVWGISGGLSINIKDINTLKQILNLRNNSYNSTGGFLYTKIAGKKYNIIHHLQDDFAYLENNENGVVIMKTNLAFVIGVYNRNCNYKLDGKIKTQNRGICITVVNNLATKLRKLKY